MYYVVHTFIEHAEPIKLTFASRNCSERKVRVHSTPLASDISGFHACLEVAGVCQSAHGEGVTKGKKGNTR